MVAEVAGLTVPTTPIAPPVDLPVIATPVVDDAEKETPEREAGLTAPITPKQPILKRTPVTAAQIAATKAVLQQPSVEVSTSDAPLTATIVDPDAASDYADAPDRQAKPAAIIPQTNPIPALAVPITEAQPDRIPAPTPTMTTALPVNGSEASLPTQDQVDVTQAKSSATVSLLVQRLHPLPHQN